MRKIAVVHNLRAGGAKKALHDFTQHLSHENHIDLYQFSNDSDQLYPLDPYISQKRSWQFNPSLNAYFSNPYIYTPAILFDLKKIFSLSKTIAREINTHNYDWVFIHHDQYIQNPVIGKYLSSPVVVYCQEPFRLFHEPPCDVQQRPDLKVRLGLILMRPFHALLKKISSIGMKHADLILTNSFYSRETIYKAYNRWSTVSYLGVDTDRYSPANVQRENLALSVGAINWRKSHITAIDALGALPAESRPRLIIITPNVRNRDEENFLAARAKRLEVSMEIVAGISDDELIGYYRRALAVLCVSIMEPFGLVPLESMACGTPVIAVNEAGYRESVVHEQTGFLVNRDPVEIADRIRILQTQPDLYNHLSRNGRNHVEKEWNWPKRYIEFTAIIDKFLHNYHAHGRR